jgi:hypothetical protein
MAGFFAFDKGFDFMREHLSHALYYYAEHSRLVPYSVSGALVLVVAGAVVRYMRKGGGNGAEG